MSDGVFTAPQAYEYAVLNKWLECGEQAKLFRSLMLERVETDKETGKVKKLFPDNSAEGRRVMANYVSCLTALWGELKIKVDGCNNAELKRAFYGKNPDGKFEVAYYAPANLYEDIDAIFDLDLALRQAIEEFKITKFEV